VSDERASQDERKRERERDLAAAQPGDERALARVRFATSERRRGQLDLAALALEEALREGGALELAGSELAAVLAEDTGDPGAYRALACFAAVRPPEPATGPFPLAALATSASHLAQKASLFRAVFRALPDQPTRMLARSIGGLVPGATGDHGAGRWSASLGRAIGSSNASALDVLYARLLGCARRRITARLDTPGPIREVARDRFPLEGDRFELAFRGDDQAYVLRRSAGALVLRDQTLFAGQWLHHEGAVLPGVALDDARLVPSSGGTFVVGLDPGEGMVHASFSVPGRYDLSRARRKVGVSTGIAAASACASGLAVFLDGAGRVFTVSTDGRVSRERRLGPGFEVISAASNGASDVFVLARTGRSCVLLRLDPELRPVGEPAPVPPLRAPREARVEWPTPDLVLVIDGPDLAHAFGADERRLAWTARIKEPLDDLTGTVAEALELLAFGAIESEFGAKEGDLGLARWTRDGLGRHGPTVRLEIDPGARVDDVRVATRGSMVAVAHREGGELTLRVLELLPAEAKYPAGQEWTYAVEAELPEP
jgi:hypothetical protein